MRPKSKLYEGMLKKYEAPLNNALMTNLEKKTVCSSVWGEVMRWILPLMARYFLGLKIVNIEGNNSMFENFFTKCREYMKKIICPLKWIKPNVLSKIINKWYIIFNSSYDSIGDLHTSKLTNWHGWWAWKRRFVK